MASPDEVRSRPERRWLVIGGFFVVLFVALLVRLFFLQVIDYKASVAASSRTRFAPHHPRHPRRHS